MVCTQASVSDNALATVGIYSFMCKGSLRTLVMNSYGGCQTARGKVTIGWGPSQWFTAASSRAGQITAFAIGCWSMSGRSLAKRLFPWRTSKST